MKKKNDPLAEEIAQWRLADVVVSDNYLSFIASVTRKNIIIADLI
ncbi:MAG: hypothetical protein Q4C00_02840 [Bacillota bacterium]|nr:hypothetical protein [Bacillota bacterium]